MYVSPNHCAVCLKLILHCKSAMRRCVLSHVRLFAAPWTVACQASLSVGFSRQEYWSRLPFPPPGDLPDQGSSPRLLHLLHWQLGSLPLAPPGNQLHFNKEKRLSSTNHLYSLLGSWGLESWCYTPKKIFSFFFFLFSRDKTQSPDTPPPADFSTSHWL